MSNEGILDFCENLPKVELHAHLGGSLSDRTLKLLGVPESDLNVYKIKGHETLEEAFKLFKVAHDATTTCEAIYLATSNVIEEFARDNVIYLELRTTPREEVSMTKREYIETIVKAIRENQHKIVVKLLLSLDRRHDFESLAATLALILEMKDLHPDIIKGVDLSGDPYKGSFPKELFVKARDGGLKVTLHCAEIQNHGEVEEILKFKPDRIGHGTFIHPRFGGSAEVWELYKSNPIPIEICLTSNVLCRTAKSYGEHHVQEWINSELPFTVNTDDKGVFNTTSSKEHFHFVKHLQATKSSLLDITLASIDYSFASEGEKSSLKTILAQWKGKNEDRLK